MKFFKKKYKQAIEFFETGLVEQYYPPMKDGNYYRGEGFKEKVQYITGTGLWSNLASDRRRGTKEFNQGAQ